MLTEPNLAITQSCWTCPKLDWWWIPVCHFRSACFSFLLFIICSSLEIENLHGFKNTTEKNSPEYTCSGHWGCYHYLVILRYQFCHLLYNDKDNIVLKEGVNVLQKNEQPKEKKRRKKKREFHKWILRFPVSMRFYQMRLSLEKKSTESQWITLPEKAGIIVFISIFYGCNRDIVVWNSRYIIIIERNIYAIKYLWCYLELLTFRYYG